MQEINEKRDSLRMNVMCEIYCKYQDSDKLHSAWCISLSGSGISFMTTFAFKLGDEIEVKILSESTEMQAMDFKVKITRVEIKDNGLYEFGALINR